MPKIKENQKEEYMDEAAGQEPKEDVLFKYKDYSSKPVAGESSDPSPASIVEEIKKEPYDLNGWMPLKDAPHNGMPCYVTNDPEEEGVLAFWKKTRAFANATHRWEEYGKFVDFMTGTDLSFEPKYYKNRY